MDKRRIEAVEELWSSVIELSPAKYASILMSTLKFDVCAKEAAKNPNFRQIFEVMGGTIDMNTIAKPNAIKLRPFLSEISWALFSAYQSIVLFAVTQLQILKSGLDMPDILDTEKISNLVQIALPHHTEYIKKYGSTGYHHLLEELETRLLKELQNILQGTDSDKASIEQAAAILKETDLIRESISNTSST